MYPFDPLGVAAHPLEASSVAEGRWQTTRDVVGTEAPAPCYACRVSTPRRLALDGGHFAQLRFIAAEGTPSEAEGTILGLEFYFYARFNHWSFAVSPKRRVDPLTLSEIEDTAVTRRGEWFDDEAIQAHRDGFVRTCSPYGEGEFAASYMPEVEMIAIMVRCLNAFVKACASDGASRSSDG